MKTSAELQSAVREYQEGDRSRFNSVYELSYPYLHTCVIHIVKDEDTAMDMLQETYLEVSKNISQLQDAQSFLGWAAMIANRKCYAYLKKNKNVLLYEGGDDEEEKTDFFDNIADDEEIIPESILQDKEKQRLMKEIIDNLSDMQRLCIIGYYYNEQKQEDIARELGIPVNTVKTYLSRAKVKIKAEVEELDVKKGTRLYTLIPFFALFFDQEAQACEAAPMPEKLQQAVRKGKGMQRLAKGMKLKIAAAVAVVGAAAVIGVVVLNNNAEKSSEEAEVQESRAEQETEESSSAGETETGQDIKEQETEAEPEPAMEAKNVTDCFEVLPISGKYDSVMYANQGLIPVSLDGKWGLVTYEDEVVVPISYKNSCLMVNEEGQSYFSDENGYYVFDRSGAELFHTENRICAVSEGIVLTVDELGIYSYYDLSGALIYELSGDYYMEEPGTDYGYMYQSTGVGFSEGCGILNDGGTMFHINASGDLTEISDSQVISVENVSDAASDSGVVVDASGVSFEFYTDIPVSPVTEGYYISRAQIMEGPADLFYVSSADGSVKYEIRIGDLFGMEGTTIENTSNSWQLSGFLKDGLYRYGYGTILNVDLSTEEGEKCYLLDLSKSGGSMEKGLLAVKDVINLADEKYWLFGEEDRWGYIDHSGNEMAVFDDASGFHNGKALIIENGTAFTIDESFEKLGEGCNADSVRNYGEIFEIKAGGQSYLVTL